MSDEAIKQRRSELANAARHYTESLERGAEPHAWSALHHAAIAYAVASRVRAMRKEMSLLSHPEFRKQGREIIDSYHAAAEMRQYMEVGDRAVDWMKTILATTPGQYTAQVDTDENLGWVLRPGSIKSVLEGLRDETMHTRRRLEEREGIVVATPSLRAYRDSIEKRISRLEDIVARHNDALPPSVVGKEKP